MMTLWSHSRDRRKGNYKQRKMWPSQILKESQMGRGECPGQRLVQAGNQNRLASGKHRQLHEVT